MTRPILKLPMVKGSPTAVEPTLLARTSLTGLERAVLQRFLALLREELGEDLRAVWLYGSRARGERPSHDDSDVDLIILFPSARERQERIGRVYELLAEAAGAEGTSPSWYSLIVAIGGVQPRLLARPISSAATSGPR